MEVTVNTAKLVIEEREVPLTVRLAKSLPVDHTRWDAAVTGSRLPAICKIPRKVIYPESYPTSFLLLVNHPVSGLCWQDPVYEDGNFPGLADNLGEIPTIVLL